MTSEMFWVLFACLVVAGVLMGAVFSEARKKPPEIVPRWRSFRIHPQRLLSPAFPAVLELPEGLELTSAGRLTHWSPHFQLVDRKRDVRISFKPGFFSGNRVIKAQVSGEAIFTLRLERGRKVGLQMHPPRDNLLLKIIGDPSAKDWELRRDGRTIAAASTAIALPKEQDEDPPPVEDYGVEVLANEDPVPILALATGLEVLRRLN